MADVEKEIQWKFSRLGDDDVSSVIKSLGEEATRANAKRLKEEDDLWKAKIKAAEQAKKVEEKAWADVEKAAEKASKALAKEASDIAKAHEKAAKETQKVWDRANKQILDSFASVGKGIANGLGLATFSSVTSFVSGAARDAMKLQGQSRRIAIDARRPGEAMVDPNVLRREFERTAIANPGMNASDVASGVGAFRQTSGNLDKAREFSGVIAKMSQAFGKDAEEVGKVAGKVFREFKPKSAEEMGDALAAINARAKQGGVTFEQAAGQFTMAAGRIKGAGYSLETLGTKGLNALMVSAGEGGDPEKAGQAVGMFMSKLSQQAVKLKKKGKGGLGLDIYGTTQDERGQAQMRPIQEIIADLAGKARDKFKDKGLADNAAPMMAELRKMFGGGGRGSPFAVMEPMLNAFNKAYGATKGTAAEKTAAGQAAVKAKFEELSAAQGNYKDALQDAAEVQKTLSARWTAAQEVLKEKIANAILPGLVTVSEKLGKGEFVNALDALGAHIWKMAHPEGPTKMEELQKAQKNLSDWKATMAGKMNWTPEDMKKKRELERAVDVADAAAMSGSVGKTAAGPMGREEFVKRYAELGGNTDLDKISGESAYERAMGGSDLFHPLATPQTNAQETLVNDVKAQVAEDEAAKKQAAAALLFGSHVDAFGRVVANLESKSGSGSALTGAPGRRS